MKIKNIEVALLVFEVAAIKYSDASEQGDYEVVNKNYNIGVQAITFLKQNNALGKLLTFLKKSPIGVCLAAATYLLPEYEEEAVKVLEEISKSSSFHSFEAQITLKEWRNGNLKV